MNMQCNIHLRFVLLLDLWFNRKKSLDLNIYKESGNVQSEIDEALSVLVLQPVMCLMPLSNWNCSIFMVHHAYIINTEPEGHKASRTLFLFMQYEKTIETFQFHTHCHTVLSPVDFS